MGRVLRWVASFLLVGVLAPAGAAAVVERPFTPRFTANEPGAIWITGSTLMTCPAAAASCAASQAGTATGAALSNNGYAMVPVDVDADPSTFSSSSSTFAPPAGYEVLFAGLYFGGRVTAGSGGAAAPNAAARGTALFKPAGGAVYAPVTGEVDDSTAITGAYVAFADVTDQVRAAGAGRYAVANVQSGTGLDRYAGWALIVVYRDPSQPLRNLTVFDGLASIGQSDPPLQVGVSGFKTPLSGPVRTSVGIAAYEGDRGSAGDRLALDGQLLSDAANPATNLFNSSVSFEGTNTVAQRLPPFVNGLGFDSDRIRADGVLGNGATTATLQASTTLDQYLIQAVTFTTDLSAPVLELDKTVADLDGGEVAPGDTLRYTLTVRNTGDDAATGVVVSDAAPPGTALAGGAATFDDLGTLAPGASATRTFDVVVDGGAPDGFAIENVARASGTGATAGRPVNAESPAVTSVVRRPPFAATLDVTPAVPTSGEPAVAEITIISAPGEPVEDAEATVVIPGADLLSGASPDLGTLTPGEPEVVRTRFRPRDSGVLRPLVVVSGAGVAPQRIALGTVRVKRGRARLTIRNRAGVSLTRRGRTVRYRIAVRAARKAAAAHGVRVCAVPGRGVRLEGRKCRSLGTLAPGRTRVLHATARVTAGAGVVRTTARASGANARTVRAAARVRVVPERARACGASAPRAHAAC